MTHLKVTSQDVLFQIPFRFATGIYTPLCCLSQYNFPALSKNSETLAGHLLVEMMVSTFQISLYF